MRVVILPARSIAWDEAVNWFFPMSSDTAVVHVHAWERLRIVVASLTVINLEGRGRLLQIDSGGRVEIVGGGELRARGGDAGEEAGGGMLTNIRSMLNIDSSTLTFDGCQASFAGGAYLLGGRIFLRGTAARLVAHSCRATQFAGGGISVWAARVRVEGDDGEIACLNCSTPHHGGGFIQFLGMVALIGARSRIFAFQCRSGVPGSIFSHGGGIQIGQNFPGYLREVPRLILGGTSCMLMAQECESGSGAGIQLTRVTVLALVESASLVAQNNIVYDNLGVPTAHAQRSIAIRNCTFPIHIPLVLETPATTSQEKDAAA